MPSQGNLKQIHATIIREPSVVPGETVHAKAPLLVRIATQLVVVKEKHNRTQSREEEKKTQSHSLRWHFCQAVKLPHPLERNKGEKSRKALQSSAEEEMAGLFLFRAKEKKVIAGISEYLRSGSSTEEP